MWLTTILSFFPLRSRKRKQEEEEESDDEEIDKEEGYESSDDEDLQSDSDSSDDEDDFIDSEGDNRIMPWVRGRWEWGNVTEDVNGETSFQTIDGDKIFCTRRWSSGRTARGLNWYARGVMVKGERALISKQRKRTITLERVFRQKSTMSQVPYREFTIFYFILLMSLIFKLC